ncbi:MAG: 2Fe-2S iron-sulfur cluster binding domain-containing protein [Propionibacteriales bacterium]|nr:2Fe-2S iron-sulfur cluster binding domain-containing protein [Propionibacteriales bacterium]
MSTTVRVHRTTWLADGVVRLELCDPGGAELGGWEPGAHLSLHLPNGLTRQYSLCGDPADRHTWTVAVLREPASRGGSSWVHERLTAGTVLEVDGPRNNFALAGAEEYLLIAGGIGITPLLAMARSLTAQGASWRMFYCGRSRSSMAFLSELDIDRLTVHADDERGGPPDLSTVLAGVSAGTAVYCCGPEPLIAAVEAAAPDPAQVHVERFKPAAAAAPSTADSAFDVVCAGSGTRVRVEPDVSVLDALTLAGMDVPFSCQEGVCGSCETKVLDGEPDHRDFVLSDAEKAANATMLPCVSRCRSAELVLDLG